MRRLTNLAMLFGLISSPILAGTITSYVTPLGADHYRISYNVTGFEFLANQELDIRFDIAEYSALSSPSAPAGFDVLLLQPGNPPGAFGDLSIAALFDRPSISGGFSVEVWMYGGVRPDPQPFSINQLDQNGNIVSVLATGDTTHMPEPGSGIISGMGLLALSGIMAIHRRSRNT